MGRNSKSKCNSSKESFKVLIKNSMLYDRLHILSAEYSMPIEELVNLAVKRLIDDVDFVRELRAGKIKRV